MKTSKRLLSVLVVCSLVFSLFVGTGTVAYGDEKTAEQVVITALPTFEVGGSIADANITFEPAEGVNVRTVWQVYDAERDEYTRWFNVKDGVFESGKIYELYIYATLEEGYVPYTEMFSYKGEDLETWFADDEETGESIMFHKFGRYSDTTEITKISVKAAEAVAGEVATVDEVVLYDAAGNVVDETAVIGGVKWQSKSKGDTVDFTGETFVEEDVYFLVVDYKPSAGYSFPEEMTFVLNGEESTLVADPDSAQQWSTYSLLAPLSSVEIGGLPKVEAGNEITANITHNLTDAFVEAEWLDENNESLEEGAKFEAGKTYILNLWVGTAYQPLAEDFVFVIDGETYTPDDLDTTYNTANVMIRFVIPAADAQGEADDTESAPATGDNNMLMAWAMLAVMGAAGAMFVRRREN